jgi:superfamily II DNA or RNA helicase
MFPTHVASVQSVVRRVNNTKPPDYVIIDEAHHVIPGSTWGKCLEAWGLMNPKMRIIGVTATPERLSGEGLDGTFDTLVMGPSVADLIRDGYLSPYRMFAPPRQVDMSGLHRRMGDFIRKEAEAVMDKPKITGDAIEHYQKHLNGAPAVAFCVSVGHAQHVAEEFRAQGWRAASIDGKLKAKERKERTDDFAAGRLNILTSCDLISEGYDVPGMMGCINLRPTESLAMCLQQWGRTLRYVEGKTAIILDHVGNSARHGLPDQVREWTLEGSGRAKGKRDPDDIAVKQCKACGCVCSVTARECAECGTAFVNKPRTIGVVEGTLEEIREHEKEKYMKTATAEKRLKHLTAIGKLRNYKNPAGWAAHVLNAVVDKEVKRRVK